MAALGRVYLTLATVAACVVLAANPGFVKGWVGEELFAGIRINALLALVAIGATAGHALSATVSVLGKRLYVGGATLVAGVAHVVLAYLLGRRFGLVGITLAALLVQFLILVPSFFRRIALRVRVDVRRHLRTVVLPWATRAVPMLAIAAALGIATARVPIWIAMPLGGLVGLASLFAPGG